MEIARRNSSLVFLGIESEPSTPNPKLLILNPMHELEANLDPVLG